MILLTDLNLNQRRIVESPQGPVLIKAGPGTGKTKTLTSRIAYLISSQAVSSDNILTLTFTKKAAVQMKERLELLLEGKFNLPQLTTFHAWAYELLRSTGLDCQIISDKEQLEVIKEVIQQQNLNLSVKDLALLISQLKNSQSYSDNELVQSYNQELASLGLNDFDDLIIKLFDYLKQNPDFRQALKTKYTHIFIDEFQDTSKLQYALIKFLLNDEHNIFVIGDPNQSIYSFRGASSGIFADFKTDFPESREENLIINYRSSKNIVEISNRLFPQSLDLESFSKTPGKVTLINTLNEHSEADWIVKFIQEKIGGTDLLGASQMTDSSLRFSDFAIIYRTHQTSKILAKNFDHSGLPYQIVGGGSIYEEEYIEFLCLILALIDQYSEGNLLKILKSQFVSKQQNNFLKSFYEKLQEAIALPKNVPLSQLIKTVNNLWQPNSQTQDLVNLFLNNVIQFDNDKNGLSNFLKYLTLLKSREYYDNKSDKVILLTMHAAKGLEFKCVFICGFEDGLIPYHQKIDQNLEDLEEEKRLLYVAITRSCHELYLMYSKKRFGKNTKMSSFKKFLEGPLLLEIEDENTSKILRRKQLLKMKKSQLNLF